MASIIKFDRNAPIDWGAVAVVRMPLQALIDAKGAAVEWMHRPLEGGWLREVGLTLKSGRLAYLEENRAYLGQFILYLVRHRDMFFLKDDYEEVLRFIVPPDGAVTLLTGQVRWWKKKPPAASPMASMARPVPPAERRKESRIVDLIALKAAVQDHAGTFICEAINAPTQTKVVAFRHVVTEPQPLDASVPDIGGVRRFYSTFGSIAFYFDEQTGECAKFIADPSKWPELQRHFRMWIDPLQGPGCPEALPDWIDDCLVIGEEPRTGNYLLVPCAGRCEGHVFVFDHDGFDFVDEADSLADHALRLLVLDDKLLTEIATHMRLVGNDNKQWWIRESNDNLGKAARTKR